MNRRTRKQIDPLEQAMESAMLPGRYISYVASWSFVADLEGIATDIAKLIKSEPDRATRLFETFIAACHEKAEEVDDSGGDFGMLVAELFVHWIRARQQADCNPDETAKVLVRWLEDDPYGFCHRLDEDAVKVLNRAGLEAFARQVRAKYDAATHGESDLDTEARVILWSAALKHVLAAEKDIDGYLALAEQLGLSAQDYRVIASMYMKRRRWKDALAWVERGLPLARFTSDLPELKRTLLAKLGRTEDALQSAWAEFAKYPSQFSYKALMSYVRKKEKKVWHRKAVETASEADLSAAVDLLSFLKEEERLLSRLTTATADELEALSHYVLEPVANKFERSHPGVAAKLYRALAMRIVKARKSKYYQFALEHLKRAKACWLKAGVPAEWHTLMAELRTQHSRKQAIMTGLDRIIAGASTQEPTFLEKAKRRWPRSGA